MNKKWNTLIAIFLTLGLLLGCASSPEAASDETEPATVGTEEPGPSIQVPESTEEEIADDLGDEGFPDPSAGVMPVIYLQGGAPCDIVATVYLTRHPGTDLIGMVLSRGEIHPEIALKDWGTFLFDILGSQHTAIALGTDERMDPNWHEFPEAWRAAADNFWGLALPDPVYEFEPATGPELIVDLVNNSPTRVTIVAMASMIDIARAIQIDPGIIDNIAHVVIMGGAFTIPGNLNDDPTITGNTVAEWNMWIDAEAARYLFNSGVRLSIVPLDAIQYLVQPEDVDRMNAINSIVNDPGVNIASLMWNEQRGWSELGFLIWDTITIVAITHPEYFYWTYDGVDVITEPGPNQGQTIPLNNGATHTRYATDADYEAIMEQIFETMQGGALSPDGDTSWVIVEGTTITGLGGRWEGDTSAGFRITFNLNPVCELDTVCGTFEIPDFSLTGDITFISIEGDIFEFRASNFSYTLNNEDLHEYLQVLADSTLKYVSTGPEGTNQALLFRQ